MTVNIKKEIFNYFKDNIYKFIFKDIKKCIKARANYIVALALASYTEYLGGLITGTLGISGKGKERFAAALGYFEWNGDVEYYKSFTIKFRDVDFQIKNGDIYSLFRCGLAHEYFVKGDSLVHNNPDGQCVQQDKGIELFDDNGRKRLRFHTNAYFRDFKKACKKYYHELISAGEAKGNKELVDNYTNALERIRVREIKV